MSWSSRCFNGTAESALFNFNHLIRQTVDEGDIVLDSSEGCRNSRIGNNGNIQMVLCATITPLNELIMLIWESGNLANITLAMADKLNRTMFAG